MTTARRWWRHMLGQPRQCPGLGARIVRAPTTDRLALTRLDILHDSRDRLPVSSVVFNGNLTGSCIAQIRWVFLFVIWEFVAIGCCDYVPMLFQSVFRCSGQCSTDVLVIFWCVCRFSSDVRVMFLWCSGGCSWGVPVVSQWCFSGVSVCWFHVGPVVFYGMLWWCSNGVPGM